MLSSDLITTYSTNPRPEPGDMVIQIGRNIDSGSTRGRVTTVTAWVAYGDGTPSDRLHLDKVELPYPEDSEQVQQAIARMRDTLPAMRAIAAVLPALERRRELADGWAGIDWCVLPTDHDDDIRSRTYQVLEMRDSLTQLWARTDREGTTLRADQQQIRNQYETQRAELAELDREVMPAAMRAAVTLHLYGMTAHTIAASLPGIPGPTVDRWLERLSTADAATLAGVEPGSWRGAVSRGSRPAEDGRFGREPWWCRATIQLSLGHV
ncbi:hypothetical protein ACIOEX_02290 [Streptomyces sp. NPDC087850]|uniref:hypothetical protein n=1 Tax=Streptomyces sp. NPDC087850 TaxID=3365809 RepID=UPI0038251CD1